MTEHHGAVGVGAIVELDPSRGVLKQLRQPTFAAGKREGSTVLVVEFE
jgi:hypothetical protein